MVIMMVVTVTMMEIGYERSFWSQNKISGAVCKNPDLNSVKLSHYRPGLALRALGGWYSLNFYTIGT
jgi:hypothetical protein